MELFHYSDNTKFGAFTKHLKRVVEKLKKDNHKKREMSYRTARNKKSKHS